MRVLSQSGGGGGEDRITGRRTFSDYIVRTDTVYLAILLMYNMLATYIKQRTRPLPRSY